jgi:hypothetical protein
VPGLRAAAARLSVRRRWAPRRAAQRWGQACAVLASPTQRPRAPALGRGPPLAGGAPRAPVAPGSEYLYKMSRKERCQAKPSERAAT